MSPILSVCIPTFNRASYLDETLSVLTKEAIFRNTDNVEIVISNNDSTDNTDEICRKYKSLYPDKIVYVKQEANIKDRNFVEVLKLANGKYAKLNNDTLFFKEGHLEKFVDYLLSGEAKSIVYFCPKDKVRGKIVDCNNNDEFFRLVTYNNTWIGGLCLKNGLINTIENPDRFSHLNFAQVDILARLIEKEKGVSVYGLDCFDGIHVNKKSGYNLVDVWGKNLNEILENLCDEELINRETVEKYKKIVLDYANSLYFDVNDDNCFGKENYFRTMFPIYGRYFYFYTNYLKWFFRRLSTRNILYSVKKDSEYKTIRVLGVKIKQRRKKN